MIEALRPDARRSAVMAENASGSTPLLHVCRRLLQSEVGIFSGDSFERELELAQVLLRCGADLYARDVFGETPARLLEQLSTSKRSQLAKLDLPQVFRVS